MALRAGLIGYGVAGRLLHAPLLKAAGFDLAGAVTTRAEALRADHPSAKAYATPEDMCSSDVDLVVVASPDHLHVQQAALALSAGKHVVIDKPMAATSVEALQLAAQAEAANLALSVFHNRRWDNDFLTVKKLVQEGALGEVAHYAARWDRYRPEPTGNWREQFMQGELYGLGSHLMDQALVLFGTPDWLFADVYKQRDAPGQSDGFDILMGKGKLRMSLGVNLLAADELRLYRVRGSQAAFVKTGLDPQEAQLRAREGVQSDAFGVEEPAQSGALIAGAPRQDTRIVSERGDWLAFYRQMRAAIVDRATVPVAPREAARVIAMLEAAMESSRTGARLDISAWLTARGCT